MRDSDGVLLWEHMPSLAAARDFSDDSSSIVRRTVSTSPWEQVPDSTKAALDGEVAG